MKLLSFSGAATKIAAHAAHGKIILESGYKPDIVVGVSSGALIILPLLLGKHDMLKEFTTNLKLSDIFSKTPVNEKGKETILSYFRALFTGSMGEMNNLKNTISKFITKEEWNEFKTNPNSPYVYVGVTNITKDRFDLVLANNYSYGTLIKLLMASSSIPLYVPPVKIGNHYFYDGGLRYHNAGIEVLRKNSHTIKEYISVYSRPQFPSNDDPAFNGKYFGRNVSKTFDSFQNGSTVKDQNSEIDFCLLHNIKITQRFSPSIMKGIYDVDNERLKLLYESIK